VAVTGANGQVGKAVLKALESFPAAVTALVRAPSVVSHTPAVEDWLRSEQALRIVRQAEAVVHLAGTLNPPDHDYEEANVAPAERLIAALDPRRTRKIVFLSYVGASEASKNSYLRTKARVERMLRATGIPVLVFRCTHIVGTPTAPGPTARTMLAIGARSVTVLGNGKQRIAPVFVGDVAAAIVAALGSGISGTFDLQGPEVMSLDELVHILNAPYTVEIRHVPAFIAPLLAFVGPKLPAALIDLMVRDCRSNAPSALEVFGAVSTSLRTIWKVSPVGAGSGEHAHEIVRTA